MTPARSLAASVVALGFAGSLTAPLPAAAAPAPCERAENFAAQSGAELLRIERLEVRAAGAERPVTKPAPVESEPTGATDRILGADASPMDPSGGAGDDDGDTLSEGIGDAGVAVLEPILPGGVDTLTNSPSLLGSDDLTPDTPLAAADEDTGGQGGGGVTAEEPAVLREVGLGEARTALVGTADVKSAAIARILDADAGGKDAWTRPIVQQAPPGHARPDTRETPSGRLGPLRVGAGEISAHARWDAGMACGSTAGEAARSVAELRSASLLDLVRVPEKVTGRSTTAVERRGGTPHSVAATTVTAGRIDLAGGQVRVRVLRPPSLVAQMSANGGDVRYRPALIEVSGPGVATKRLTSAGDHVDLALAPDRHATETGTADLGDLRPGSALPLPAIPGLPRIAPVIPSPPLESAAAGTRLRISLGGVRRAEKGHAIAARATAIEVSVTEGGGEDGRTKDGYAGGSSLDLAIGLMEAAAVAPGTAAVNGTSGAAGGLPITGPRAGGLAIGGMALLVAGIAAVALSVRRRRSRP